MANLGKVGLRIGSVWKARVVIGKKNGRQYRFKYPGRLVLSTNSAWNVYNFRRGLIASFQERGFDVVVASQTDRYVKELEAIDCRHEKLFLLSDSTALLPDLWLFFSYIVLFKRFRPALYLSYTIKPNIYGTLAARLCGVPAISNVSGLGTIFIRERWLTRLVVGLYRVAFKGSRVIFFQNNEDRSLFLARRIVNWEKTRLLPGSGINMSCYNASLVSQRNNSESKGITFLFVGRLLRDKGVEEFVQAAGMVKGAVSNARFQMLGFLDAKNHTAIGRATVERWVAAGVIEYLGATDDVRPFIAAADCVVLPSYREGTPRTLLEGAAMGRPLIATDVPGCREVVEDGRNGLLCKVRDASDLAEKMLALVDMSPAQRARMGRAGREKVEREFDEKIVIDRYLEVIDQILAERASTVPWHRRLRNLLPFAKKVRPHCSASPVGQGRAAGSSGPGAKVPKTAD